MILDAIFAIIFAVVETVIGALLALIPPVPGWFVNAMSSASSAFAFVYQMDAWLPVSLLLTVIGAVLTVYVAGIAIGAVRWIVSYFLGGGGTT